MTNDEAIRLARTLLHTPNMNKYEINIRQFCDYILSGDMKREIENAAFVRAALIVMEYERYGNDVAIQMAREIRALIQLPAQKKEDVE